MSRRSGLRTIGGVPPPIRVDRATARRFLVARHHLAPPRSLPAEPDSVRTVVSRLGSLQFDPLDVTGRNHDLVLAARIDGYRRAWTDDLLYRDRWLYEAYNKGLSLLPTAELPFFRVGWDREHAIHRAGTFVEHADLVDELLERIRHDGPLSSTDVAPRAAIDWYWRPTNQVRAILEALAEAGVLALARREGNRRIYDLAERLFPPELLAERRTEEEARRHMVLSRFRAHGLLGMSGGQQEIWIGTGPATDRYRHRDALIADGDLVPVAVEGIRGERLVLASEARSLEAAAISVAAGEVSVGGIAPGVAFLAPLDPLVWDRALLRSLFDFDYVWEVYVPAARRRWGYYVLPILWGDRLVGRIEPRFDRAGRALRILDLWWEDGFDPLASEVGGRAFTAAFVVALVAHARFGDSGRIVWPRAARHRALGVEVRARLGPGGSVRA
jgi:uncharacterized protein YcaQ